MRERFCPKPLEISFQKSLKKRKPVLVYTHKINLVIKKKRDLSFFVSVPIRLCARTITGYIM